MASNVGGTGGKLHLRLFLEGVEVPVIAATVQSNPNAPATASIQVVPTDDVLELKPRTLVHLFYYDFTQEDVEIPEEAGQPTIVNTNLGANLKQYKLLFGGEIVGIAVAKTPLSRQMVLQCADWSTYWDTTYQMFISFAPHGNFLTESSAVWAGGNSLFDDILDGHSAVMNRFLHEKPLTPGLKDVKGLMGGIIRLLEAMGGVPKQTRGVNDFFSIAELMRHLLQQITADEDDDTAQKLFANKEFWQWLERGTLSMGELVTFRDLLKLLFQWIYYEVVPITSPMYVPSITSTTKTKKVTSGATPLDIKKLLEDSLSRAKKASIAASHRGAKYDSAEPDKNEALSISGSISGSGLKSLMGRADIPKAAKDCVELAISYLDNIVNGLVTFSVTESRVEKLNVDYVRSWDLVAKKLDQALLLLSKGTTRNKSKVVPGELELLHTQVFRPDCFFAAPPRCNVFFPDVYTQFTYQRSFLQEPTRLRLQTSWFGSGGDALLADYFYAPSLTEIRKVAKAKGDKGIRTLLPWEVYTGILPKFETVAEMNYISNKRQKDLNKDVRGKGISYASRVANFNYMRYRFAARTMEISMRFNPAVVCGFPGALIEKPFNITQEVLQDALKKAGVSNASTDMNDIVQSIPTLAKALKAPTQYLGMIASVVHSIDQNGGTTNVVMTHARTHRLTEDEFLMTFAEEVLKETNIDDVTTVLDAEDILKKGDSKLLKWLKDCTPQNVPELMQKEEDSNNNTKATPLYDRQSPLSQKKTSLKTLVTGLFTNVTIPELGNTQGTIVTSEVDDVPLYAPTKEEQLNGTATTILAPKYPGTVVAGKTIGPNGGTIINIQVESDQILKLSSDLINQKSKNKKKQASGSIYVWKKAVIHEQVSSKTLKTPLPVEELLRPPWFSPLYSNLFIGDFIYDKFFGIGSIVDEQVFYNKDLGAAGQGLNHKSKSAILNEIQAANGDIAKTRNILNNAGAQKLSDLPSIETSLDTLAYLYGEIRRNNLDAHKFITDYTNRPIATLEDIFGSQDLKYEEKNGVLVKTSGKSGFHSTSIGPWKDLVGLVDNPDEPMPRVSTKGKKVPLSRSSDPRPGRRQKVLAYKESLVAGTGSLAIGLRG